jgi:hypothetical protein
MFAYSNKLGYHEDKDQLEEEKSLKVSLVDTLESSNDSRRYSSGKIILLRI